jgi:hypothetical protein
MGAFVFGRLVVGFLVFGRLVVGFLVVGFGVVWRFRETLIPPRSSSPSPTTNADE